MLQFNCDKQHESSSQDPVCNQRSQGRLAIASVYTFGDISFALLFLVDLVKAELTVCSCQHSLIFQDSPFILVPF